jgi:beta-phosphoglucomutase
VLWDLDGTLADSRAYHWRAWRDTMAADGVVVTEAQFDQIFGQRNDRILRTWLGEDADPERVERLGDAKEEAFRALVEREGLVPLPGAAEWTRRLGREGWRQAIASSAPRRNVEVVRRALGLADALRVFASAEDVHRGKPDPEVFLVAAARVGVPPARCIVVEDAAAGIEAARRAGMPSIGVGRPLLAQADLAVASLTDLSPGAFERLVGAR